MSLPALLGRALPCFFETKGVALFPLPASCRAAVSCCPLTEDINPRSTAQEVGEICEEPQPRDGSQQHSRDLEEEDMANERPVERPPYFDCKCCFNTAGGVPTVCEDTGTHHRCCSAGSDSAHDVPVGFSQLPAVLPLFRATQSSAKTKPACAHGEYAPALAVAQDMDTPTFGLQN